jgi:hypothetical protein
MPSSRMTMLASTPARHASASSVPSSGSWPRRRMNGAIRVAVRRRARSCRRRAASALFDHQGITAGEEGTRLVHELPDTDRSHGPHSYVTRTIATTWRQGRTRAGSPGYRPTAPARTPPVGFRTNGRRPTASSKHETGTPMFLLDEPLARSGHRWSCHGPRYGGWDHAHSGAEPPAGSAHDGGEW